MSRSESVTAWLKEGRESAQRKQEVIEVNSQLPVRIDMYSTHYSQLEFDSVFHSRGF